MIKKDIKNISGGDSPDKKETIEMKFDDQCLPSMSHYQMIKQWAVADVINWLENRQLHKFIILFQKHHVTGKELVDLNLPFLETYEHILADEREVLLAEIYNLLNPRTVHASEEDLTKIKSPIDKKKYFAAIELAQSKSASLSGASVVFVCPSNRSVSVPSSESKSSPHVKPHHKSESGLDPSVKIASHISGTKKRKSVSKTNMVSTKSLYECITCFGRQCVQCIELSAEQQEHVSMMTNTEGHVIVNKVSDDLQNILHHGDRVLEINGCIVDHSPSVDLKSYLAAMLCVQSPTSMVIVTEHFPNSEDVSSDDKWKKLHTILIEMRDSDTIQIPQIYDLENVPLDSNVNETLNSSVSAIPDTVQHDLHIIELKEEITKLKAKITEHQLLNESLKIKLEDTDAIMHDLTLSRDKAINKLCQTRNNLNQEDSGATVDSSEYYRMTMESLNLELASKEEVVISLREIVSEASKQKWYLDRLVSLVIEESPWLLDEVDTDFDKLALTNHSKEFC